MRDRGRATGCGWHCCIAAYPVDCHCKGVNSDSVGLDDVGTGCACTQAQCRDTGLYGVEFATVSADATTSLEDQACCCDVFGCGVMTVQNVATGFDGHVSGPRVDALQRYVAAGCIE